MRRRSLPGLAYVLKIRTGLLRDLGAALSPFNSWLFIQGLETLPLRARAHVANAQEVARFLRDHPAVTSVDYAGLPDHPDHERASSYFPLGPGAVLGFEIKGGLEAGKKFIESVKTGFARGQYPRRQDPGDPSGQHDPPATEPGGAAERGCDARPDPRVGGYRGRRGHHRRSRPGLRGFSETRSRG